MLRAKATNSEDTKIKRVSHRVESIFDDSGQPLALDIKGKKDVIVTVVPLCISPSLGASYVKLT